MPDPWRKKGSGQRRDPVRDHRNTVFSPVLDEQVRESFFQAIRPLEGDDPSVGVPGLLLLGPGSTSYLLLGPGSSSRLALG